MNERSRGITVYSIAIISFGVYNLMGVGNYGQFSLMFKGLPSVVIAAAYVFTILYGICAVYCGIRILKLEDWARKTIVGLAAVSVISGFLLNRTVMTNLKNFLMTEESQITADMVAPVYTYAVVFVALVTVFELSLIYYFTRPGVISQFRRR
ncbi:MAG: hypothetical protein ABID83_02995 [Candidatus Omnitrophota bacterium]